MKLRCIRSTERRDTATDAARNPAPLSSRPNCFNERFHDGSGRVAIFDVCCKIGEEEVAGVDASEGIGRAVDEV
jgi:hypothetical protein